MRTTCVIAEIGALLGYLVAAVGYPLRLLRPDLDFTRAARAGWLFGAALQALGLVAHALTTGGQVIVGRYANVVFVLVLMVVVGLELLGRRSPKPALPAFAAPIVFVLVLTSVFRPTVSLPPAESPWIRAHIALTLLSYACFAIAFAHAAAYLVSDALLKRKQILRLRLLPPLERADNAAHLAVAVGYPVYTVGLVVGGAAAWAHRLPADAKVVLALACWLLLTAYLVVRHFTRHRGKRVQILVILAFALALGNFVLARHDARVYDVTHEATTAP